MVSQPSHITRGPDGNLWFTNFETALITRLEPDGTMTTFGEPGSKPWASRITRGSDGNLWFSTGRYFVGRIDPSGERDLFPASTGVIQSMVLGPDGNVWFMTPHGFGRIRPTGGVAAVRPWAGEGPSSHSLTAGPQNRLWFTRQNTDQFGLIIRPDSFLLSNDIDGSSSTRSSPADLVATRSGTLWIALGLSTQVLRVDSGGQRPRFSDPNRQILGMFTGARTANGSVWFAGRETRGDNTFSRVARITPSGQFMVTDVGGDVNIGDLAVGADGAVWFTDFDGDRIGRISDCGGLPA